MTSGRAKFLLSVYRPNGADAEDPAFKEALAEVQRDPTLGSWFREQQAFDEIIFAKLRSIEVPASLPTAILAGFRATAIPRPRRQSISWLAISAVLVVGLMVLGQMDLIGPAKQDSKEQMGSIC